MKSTKLIGSIFGASLLILFTSCTTSNSLATNRQIINIDDNPNAEIAIVRNWCNETVSITCSDIQYDSVENKRVYKVLWEGKLNPKETLSLRYNTFVRNADEDKDLSKDKRYLPSYKRSKIEIYTAVDGWLHNYTTTKDKVSQYRLVDSGTLVPLKDGKFKMD